MLRRLDPFRHAMEPAALAATLAVAGLAAFRPLLLASGVLAVVLGARLYYNHGGLGDRWHAWNERMGPTFGSPDAHLIAGGTSTGSLGAVLLGLGLPL